MNQDARAKLFILRGCPYCRQVLSWMDDLKKQDSTYDLPIEIIDEAAYWDFANKYDYYYVPTFYLDEKKLHEGAATLEKVKQVLDTMKATL